MKKHLFVFLAALLALSMVLAACARTVETLETSASTDSESSSDSTATDGPSDNTNKNDKPSNNNNTNNKPNNNKNEGKYAVTETYMPEAVSAEMKSLFEAKEADFKTTATSSNPYVIRDVYNISNCGVKSISIPVIKTGEADDNGDFLFTIYVLQNEWITGLGKAPRRCYEVKINAEEYGLEENDNAVYKWIKVDLTDYEIELTQTETLGFVSDDDTIFAAFIGNGSTTDKAQRLIENNFHQMRGFVKNAGQPDVAHKVDNNTLVYDFEFERVYESKAAYDEYVAAEEAYQAMIEELIDIYAGKKISILGDSISTFANISNNTSYNSTIGGNAVFNFKGNGSELRFNGLYDEKDTYWHRLISDLWMELCVNNSWSGSCVIDNAPSRALQLHNNAGEEPDVILFYMGINDLHNKKSMGDLYEILANSNDTRSDAEKIEAWLESTSFTGSATFEQAYAKSIMNMLERYEGVEVWCLSLMVNNDGRFTTTAMKQYNRCIEALAEYFGCNYIDQNEGYITKGNCIAYSCDGKGLHPNPTGHALMEKHIVECFYEKASKEQ